MQNQIDLLRNLFMLESDENGGCTGAEVDRIKEQMDPMLLKYYLRVKERRGTGVAILSDRTCNRCRMVYPEAHPIVSCSGFVHKCEYCGRLLVSLDNPETTAPRVESRPVESLHFENDETGAVSPPGWDKTSKITAEAEIPKQTEKVICSDPENQKPVVLHVDNDAACCNAIRHMLEPRGYVVLDATSGTEALRALTEHSPSLIISEVMLPDMSGIDLFRRIRSRGAETEVIFVTDSGNWESNFDLMNIGAFDYIDKPLDEDAILSAVSQAMENSQTKFSG
jgi:CheY-like chemotaxis protein